MYDIIKILKGKPTMDYYSHGNYITALDNYKMEDTADIDIYFSALDFNNDEDLRPKKIIDVLFKSGNKFMTMKVSCEFILNVENVRNIIIETEIKT